MFHEMMIRMMGVIFGVNFGNIWRRGMVACVGVVHSAYIFRIYFPYIFSAYIFRISFFINA